MACILYRQARRGEPRKVEHYSRETHGALLEGWLRARGVEHPAILDGLPPTGFVVGGCAAGFLYLTDAPVAYVDSFVTDKAVPAYQRRAALRGLCRAILDAAELAGARVTCASTSAPTIIEAFTAEGMTPAGTGHVYLMRRI